MFWGFFLDTTNRIQCMVEKLKRCTKNVLICTSIVTQKQNFVKMLTVHLFKLTDPIQKKSWTEEIHPFSAFLSAIFLSQFVIYLCRIKLFKQIEFNNFKYVYNSTNRIIKCYYCYKIIQFCEQLNRSRCTVIRGS